MEIFKHVYVINLERDKEKLKKITSNLQKYQILFQRFNAIEGKNLLDSELKDKTTLLCRTLLCTKGIIGSGLSHMYLWDIISKSKDKWHLIFEDDIEINDQQMFMFKQLNEYLIKNPQIDAFINLNCHNPSKLFCHFMSSNPILANQFFTGGISAYLLTPNMATQLLNTMQKKVNGYLDANIAFKTFGQKNMLVTKKRFVDHDYNIYQSNNMAANIMPLLSHLLNNLGFEIYVFSMNSIAIYIAMTYQINLFTLIYVILLLLNCFWWNHPFLYIYLILEFVVYTIFKFK